MCVPWYHMILETPETYGLIPIKHASARGLVNDPDVLGPSPKRRSPMQMLNSGMWIGKMFHAPYPCSETALPLLIHLFDQLIDLFFSVTKITTLNKVLEFPLVEAASWAVELKGPQEVRCLFKVGADGVDLVDQILHADHAVLAEILFNDLVVGQRETLLVDLAVASFYVRN
jgi:hypothetical protein